MGLEAVLILSLAAFVVAIALLLLALVRLQRQAAQLKLAVQAEEAAYERTRVLLSVTEAVNSTLALEEVLHHALRHAGRLVNAPAAALYLARPGSGDLTREAQYGLVPRARGANRRLDEEPLRTALGGEQAAPVPVEPEAAPGLERGGHPRFALVLPIQRGGALMGAMELYLLAKVAVPHEQLELLHAVAAQAAGAIRHAQLYREQEESSLTDELTRMPNRRYLAHRFLQEIQRAKRHRKPIAFLMIDLDEFKSVNDGHGHLVGDQVLIEVGRILSRSMRDGDVCARYGGEEFGAIVNEAGLEGATALAERLRVSVESAGFAAGLKLTVSVGVAATDDPARMAALMDAADKALYAAKQAGRNQVRTADLAALAEVGTRPT
jgi:two-component system cell cycle response regulator